MMHRPGKVSADTWFRDVEQLLTVMSPLASDSGKNKTPVKIAVIDTGLSPDHPQVPVVYKDFISSPNSRIQDDPQHGTNSLNLILRMIDTAQIYVARVFQNGDGNSDTPSDMAEVEQHLPQP